MYYRTVVKINEITPESTWGFMCKYALVGNKYVLAVENTVIHGRSHF